MWQLRQLANGAVLPPVLAGSCHTKGPNCPKQVAGYNSEAKPLTSQNTSVRTSAGLNGLEAGQHQAGGSKFEKNKIEEKSAQTDFCFVFSNLEKAALEISGIPNSSSDLRRKHGLLAGVDLLKRDTGETVPSAFGFLASLGSS